MSHLFRLLRPELVKKYRKPLCPDGFSRFIKDTEKEEEHNEELTQATSYLHGSCVRTLSGLFARTSVLMVVLIDCFFPFLADLLNVLRECNNDVEQISL